MKSNMTTKILRAKRTLVGRAFCRVLGDRTGAVMMEYVILAVMIAAAAVVTVIYFGDTIRNMFVSAADAAAGNTKGAVTARDAAVTSAGKADKDGSDYKKKFSDQQ